MLVTNGHPAGAPARRHAASVQRLGGGLGRRFPGRGLLPGAQRGRTRCHAGTSPRHAVSLQIVQGHVWHGVAGDLLLCLDCGFLKSILSLCG